MPSDIDFDVTDSSLQVGLEVEYPVSTGDKMAGRGDSSSGLLDRIDMWPSRVGGRAVYDGTVGLEVVSSVLDIEDAESWYAEVIDHVEDEYGELYEPTGLMSNGNTAGLHIHLSEISRQTAQELAEVSQEPWAQVLFCSSIARTRDDNLQWPVFRGGRYCDLEFGSGHYNVVNERGGGHYEWRLPEPVLPEHVGLIMRFLALFVDDRGSAIEYAQERLDEVDNRITSIQRAEAVGMDIDERPTVVRSPYNQDPEGFYDIVADDWGLPEIYTVELDGDAFYTFDSELTGGFEACGVEFRRDSVLHADTLEAVTDPELRDEVERMFNRRGTESRETEATEELKKIVKQKPK